MGVSQDYYRFCVSSALPANVLESFIISANYRLCGIFHPINLCFMLSEAPFMDENAAYMIFRSGPQGVVPAGRAAGGDGLRCVLSVCAAQFMYPDDIHIVRAEHMERPRDTAVGWQAWFDKWSEYAAWYIKRAFSADCDA